MLLRPATPLSILFLAAFVLLLLSTLSTPIIKAIPLAESDGVTYGVFGYCQGDVCSAMGVGYTTGDGVFSNTTSDFDLPSGARHTLSAILIVHPLAAFMALVCFALAFAAHFHAPSHSPRYLMVLLVLVFPTLLLTLLAFLVDILLFVPHMAWGGWLVLAATIVTAVSCVIACAMRRTLVSRKVRKKRIAENAEMNGQNYYASRGPLPIMEDLSLPRVDSPPPIPTGSPVLSNGKSAEYAASEAQKQSMDDRIPLTQNPSMPSTSTDGPDEWPGTYYGNGQPHGPPRDQYGNPVPPYGSQEQPLRHHTPNGTVGSATSGGLPPFYGPPGRGRGGYPSRGRAAFGPRGRGAPPSMRGRGGSLPGYGPNRGMGLGQTDLIGGAMSGGPIASHRAPPPGYNNDYYETTLPQARAPLQAPYDHPMAPSGPNGFMHHRVVTPMNDTGVNTGGHQNVDNDLEVFPARPQRQFDGPTEIPPRQTHSVSPLSQTGNESRPSDQQWSRHNWAANSPDISPLEAEPPESSVLSRMRRALEPIAPSPSGYGHAAAIAADRSKPSAYVEDADPRFANSEPPTTMHDNHVDGGVPTALMPGFVANATGASSMKPGLRNPHTPPPGEQHAQSRIPDDNGPQMVPYHEFPDDYEGPRSPGAASDTSQFTSISQRGVNPSWRPGPPYGYQPQRGPPRQRQEDVVLQANPDFSLPGVTAPGRGRNITGRGRGGFAGRGRVTPAATTLIGSAAAAGGRYPGGTAL